MSNIKKVFSLGLAVLALVVVFGLSASKVYAATCNAIATGLWSAETTWDAGCNTNTIPAGPDIVNIGAFTVTITGAGASATTLNLTAGTSVLTTSDTSALAVSGATTLSAGSALNPGAGTYTTGTLSVSGTLTLGTGASTVSTTTIVNSGGSIILSGASGAKTFSTAVTISAGGIYNETVANATGITFSTTLNNAGTFTTSTGAHTFSGAITNTGTFNYAVAGASMTTLAASTAGTGGTFNYTGGAQTVQVIGYNNLGLSGTGVKTVAALIGATEIDGTLAISGTAQASLTGDSTANAFTVNGSAKALGTWGSGSSVATHQDSVLFAGTNLITIASGPSSPSTVITTTDPSPNTPSTTDTTAPSGTSVSINAGVSTTSSLSSTLTFTAIGATKMIISNDSNFAGASWEDYDTSISWTLKSGDGVKTVYAKFRDAAGNMSVAVSDSITVSASGTLPTIPTVVCSPGQMFNGTTGERCSSSTNLVFCPPGQMFNGTSGERCNAVISSGSGVTPLYGNDSPGASGYTFGSATVRRGTTGEACRAWQMFFNAKRNAGLVVDGNCGPLTMAAAVSWQAASGLVADGLLGPMSRAKANMQ